MNQIENYRSWGQIVGAFSFALFLNMFALVVVAKAYGAPGADRLWHYRVMEVVFNATFIFIPTLVILAVRAKLTKQEAAAQYLATGTVVWPVFLMCLQFIIIAMSAPQTT